MSNRYVVRYGLQRHVGEFSSRPGEDLPRNCEVVVRSDRGQEWAVVLCPATDRTGQYLGSAEPRGRVLREVTEEDRDQLESIRAQERGEFEACRTMIADRKLQMDLVDVERLFGGERLVFYYTAEKRVDFRELVKALVQVFKTRIEMRQIGVRDEAKLLADYGDCGKPVCCNTHLQEMPPVSMKMAKLQKATLDPTKISGRCGRLKCCLRYEYDTYEEYRRELPRVGATVLTKHGQGRVVAQEILAKQVVVRYEDRRQMIADQSEILTVVQSSGPRRPTPDQPEVN
jgi:cell fate regulator YaaT (PSP1 superfamily)